MMSSIVEKHQNKFLNETISIWTSVQWEKVLIFVHILKKELADFVEWEWIVKIKIPACLGQMLPYG